MKTHNVYALGLVPVSIFGKGSDPLQIVFLGRNISGRTTLSLFSPRESLVPNQGIDLRLDTGPGMVQQPWSPDPLRDRYAASAIGDRFEACQLRCGRLLDRLA